MKLRTLFVAIATLALAGLFWSVPHPASASVVTYSPDAPRPVNVLPSTVAHVARSTGIAAPKAAQTISYFLYNAMQTPEFWQAAQTQKTGGALTLRQNNVITDVQTRTRLPLGAVASVARGGAAMIVAEAGLMMGVGAIDFFWSDRQGMVCSNVGDDPFGQITALAARANCDFDSLDYDPEYVPNADSPGGTVWNFCQLDGLCVQYKGQTFASTSTAWCFTQSGSSTTGTIWMGFRLKGSTGGWSSTSMNYETTSSPISEFRKCAEMGAPRALGGSSIVGTAASPYTPTTTPYELRLGTAANTAGPTTPTVVSGNPTRTAKCVILGTDDVTRSGPGVEYDEEMGAMPDPRCPDLPEGVIPQSTWIESTYPGGPVVRLWQQDTAPEVVTAYEAYPLCRDSLCATELQKGATNCHVAPLECLDWFDDPNKTSTYSCKYGTYVVDLAECNVYAPGFASKPGTSTPTLNDPDVLGDPSTGSPMPSPFPSGRDAATFENPVQSPSTSRECFPTGWGVLNPIEWVLRPVQCALEWAFVPRQSVIEGDLGRLIPLYVDTMPGQLHLAVSQWSFTPPPTNCNGITLDMSWIPGQTSVQMLNACPGDPLEPFAGWSKFFFYVAFTVVGTLGSIRNASATIGYRGIGGDS